MTERFSGFQVVLDQDIREDDAEAIITAIRMIKHVVSVKPITVEFGAPEVMRTKIEIHKKLLEFANGLLR